MSIRTKARVTRALSVASSIAAGSIDLARLSRPGVNGAECVVAVGSVAVVIVELVRHPDDAAVLGRQVKSLLVQVCSHGFYSTAFQVCFSASASRNHRLAVTKKIAIGYLALSARSARQASLRAVHSARRACTAVLSFCMWSSSASCAVSSSRTPLGSKK